MCNMRSARTVCASVQRVVLDQLMQGFLKGNLAKNALFKSYGVICLP